MNESNATGWRSAGCKLNLFLHINGRRPDGYHELQTHFQLLAYGDEVLVETVSGDGIQVDWVAGDEDIAGRPAEPGDDLLYRAAASLCEAARARGQEVHCSARITLRKNVPIGGGLGGGSAAAARVLLELNRLWGVNLPLDTLCELGAHLGADVPVFLRGQSATAHGIGEELQPAEVPDAPAWYLVLVPDRHAPTAGLFASTTLRRDTPKQPDAFLRTHWRDAGFNAFEPVLLAKDPELAALRDDLAGRAGFGRLTGSGACLFAPVESAAAGQRIGEALALEHPILRRFFVASAVRTANQEVSQNRP